MRYRICIPKFFSSAHPKASGIIQKLEYDRLINPVSNNKSCTVSAMHNYNADGMQIFVYPFCADPIKKRDD